jgi:hypothetical protein
VDEHRVEDAIKPDIAHVAGHVFALGVERAAQFTHPVRWLDERERKRPLHVRSVVAASAAEFEHLSDRAASRTADHVHVERCLLGVSGRRRDDWPPIGKRVV